MKKKSTSYYYDLDGLIDRVIKELQLMKREAKKMGWENLSLETWIEEDDGWGPTSPHIVTTLYYETKD